MEDHILNYFCVDKSQNIAEYRADTQGALGDYLPIDPAPSNTMIQWNQKQTILENRLNIQNPKLA